MRNKKFYTPGIDSVALVVGEYSTAAAPSMPDNDCIKLRMLEKLQFGGGGIRDQITVFRKE
jgi:hypothetical protein